MDLIVAGLTGKEIAREIGVAYRTVEHHMILARQRLGGVNIARAAVLWDRIRRAA
ncbi:hypothetical protein GCM10028796_17320 [Ramlibacter monticola]|uniref:HTH luxR-type domain-containing protein n=1 Tax=Ramlibacter monticola TaxID=1926872 RepID=A0A937CSI9_9BURK|nr:LuxR C-terminal-related transcriptional regulator [Ramlibacter monticola]MBL0390558.1 hypothetical protein [Ramlibacter monticola]